LQTCIANPNLYVFGACGDESDDTQMLDSLQRKLEEINDIVD
jgi:hypothetical protein